MATDTSTIARPYAKAAFEFAQADNDLKAWSDFLQTAAAVTANAEVQQLLIDPRIGVEDVAEFYRDVCAKLLNAKILNNSRENFINLLAENKRFNTLPNIMSLFEAFKADFENTVDVDVLSSMPLNTAQQDKLTAQLKQRLNRDVKLNCRVDESIVGGAIIRAGDLVIDGSVTAKLSRLRDELAA